MEFPVSDTTAVCWDPRRRLPRTICRWKGFLFQTLRQFAWSPVEWCQRLYDDGGVPCFRQYGSLLGALSKGAKDGLTMVGYVVINLLVYVAVLALSLIHI